MHRSKIPLNKWLIAMQLISASERGVSARQLRQMLGISYQSAWYVSHRVRKVIGDGVAEDRQGDARGSERAPNVSASKLMVRGKTARRPRSIEAAAERLSQRSRKIL
jgi:molybdenum-dependent DNA-binding transcriptional regulator ModE